MRSIVLTLVLAITFASHASAQNVLVRDRMLYIEGRDGRVDLELPCRSISSIQIGDRVYVSTRCGVVRVELTQAGLRRVHMALHGRAIREVRVAGGMVIAVPARGGGEIVLEAVETHPGEFVDPDDDAYRVQRPEAGDRLVVRLWRPPLGLPFMDPPRQAGRWAIGGSVFAFIPLSAGGVGTITRAHIAYHAPFPLMVRADLMPLGLALSDAGNVGGALGLLSVELDLHAFGIGLGGGAVSNNEHYQWATNIEPGAMGLVAPSMRIGVTDGLHLMLRSGIAISGEGARFGFFEAVGQIPVSDDIALTLRFEYGLSGNIEGRAGLRMWAIGRGQAGSIAIFIDGGAGRLQYRGPATRGRGYPPTVEHIGPGMGFGIEGRL